MTVLFLTLSLFFIAVIIHIVIWRCKVPRRDLGALLAIFTFTFVIGIFFSCYLGIIARRRIDISAHILLFYYSLVLAYLYTYSAIAADSPSLLIIEKVAVSKSRGLSREEIGGILNNKILIEPRITDMLEGKLIYLEVDKYKLTKRGRRLVCISLFMRRLLDISKGG